MSEKFEFNIDNRLTKNEINEVKSYSQEKLETLLDTEKSFNDFINTEYRWANENYLWKNNKNIKNLQKSLWFSGKDVDWIFWKKTFMSVIKYQKENNLVIDWLAWDKTQAKLFWVIKIKKQKVSNNYQENNNTYSKSEKTSTNYSKNKFSSSENNNYSNKNYENNDTYKDWLALANFLKQKKYPKYVSWASCWANVWNLLNAFWIDWLPNYWRDWYRWSDILEKNPNFTKEYISSPYNAKPGWILVYDKWYWDTNSRQKYWHVEIATNDWYYFWWNPKKNPWWSSLEWFTWCVYYPKVA